jgi:hypothetical protein
MAPNKLFFIHIPRTSGTSMVGLLQKMYDGKKIGESVNLFEEKIYSKSYFEGNDLNMAHVDLKDAIEVCPEHEFMTILRDPVDRYLSHYYWNQMKYQVTQPHCSLREFMDREINQRDFNSMMWQLGDHFKVRERKKDEDECYHQATVSLFSFKYILLYENIDEDVHNFIKCTRIPGNWEYPHRQGSGSKLHIANLDPSLIEEIRERNSLDIKLYNFAKEMLND